MKCVQAVVKNWRLALKLMKIHRPPAQAPNSGIHAAKHGGLQKQYKHFHTCRIIGTLTKI